VFYIISASPGIGGAQRKKSEVDMAETMDELKRIVGAEHALSDPAALERYSRDHSGTPERAPLLAVRPK
jgi:hypothetical protein